MLTIPALRWGKPYKSLETQDIYHFDTGEPIAKLSTVNGGMLQLDMRKAAGARAALKQLSTTELIERCKRAGELFESATLSIGDAPQTLKSSFINSRPAPDCRSTCAD